MLMAYTKTNWNENTPITADRLNNIETGVANSLDTTTGGLVNGKLTVNGVLRVNKHIDTPIVEANTDLIINKYDFKTYYTSNEFGSYIYCGKNKSSINLTDSKMTYANPNGNIEIGPQNSAHCHFYTDRPSFYFNKDLLVSGNVSVKGTSDAHGITIDSTGAYQNLYFKNNGAVRGLMRSLTNGSGVEIHCYDSAGAWKNNFILSTETGKALVNGRRLAAFEGGNPTHCIFRYGSGLGGEAGYITFSY